LARWTRVSGLLAALVCAALAASADPDAALRFARHGEPVGELPAATLRSLLDAETVEVFEPYEAREVSFRALRFDDVLDRAFGRSWREEEELLFTCRDGYQPSVPVRRFLEHRAWLAFERVGAPFAIDKLESGRRRDVSLAPYYLIWENLDDPAVRAEGDYGWPYQLVGVEIVRARDRFPRMTPPAEAPAPVRAGFDAFRMYCSRCHPVNGEGGSIGPELNAPGSAVGLRDPDWLRRWIDDPTQFAPTSRMPALDPALPDRDATLDAIVAYLRAMAGSGGTGGR